MHSPSTRKSPYYSLLALVPVAALLSACATRQPDRGKPVPGISDSIVTEGRILEYFEKTATLPPGATMVVKDWQPAPAPGWSTGTLRIESGFRSQEINLVVTNDGRYMVRGDLIDLTVDPLQSVRDKIALDGQPVRGAVEAPVTIVEYSDFQCPYCAKASHTIEQELLAAYPGKVRLVHKNFPLTQIHPWAQDAAVAAECALAQSNDGYWKVYEALFEQQRTITPDNLKEKVLEVGALAKLDPEVLAACYDTKATLPAVQSDIAEGSALGVNSTPTFFVNGRRVAGAMPIDSFRALIDRELAGR
jgi:protein-disulfide isomerase